MGDLLGYEWFRTVTFSVAVVTVLILMFKLVSDTDAEEDELIAVMNAALKDYSHALLDSDVFLPKAPGDTVTIPLGRKRKVEISRLEDGSLKLVGDAPPAYDDDDRRK